MIPCSHLGISRISCRTFDVSGFASCLLVLDQLISVDIALGSPSSGFPSFETRFAVHPIDHLQTDLAAFEQEEVNEDG